MTGRPSHKPRDPKLAFIVGAFGLATVFVFIWLVFATGLWIGVLSVGSTAAYVGGVATWLYPVALVISGIVAWRAYRAGNPRRAQLAAVVPYLWILPIFAIILVQGSA